MGQVSGKVAIVTGGASGIGAACAETLAREGAKVVVTDVDDKMGNEVVARIAAAGGTAMFLFQDVTEEQRWPEVIAAAEKAYGRLDIMVANAGIGVSVPFFADMSLTEWRRQQAINLDGVFMSAKYAVPAMKRAGGGSIVMMSSVAGLRGSPGLAAYCATKGGVRLFAKAVALECAQMNLNIRCNSVHPGLIETPIWTKLQSSAGRNISADLAVRAKAAVPLSRVGVPQDIADGVLFLCSDASSYITGQELVIDGGITAGQVARRA